MTRPWIVACCLLMIGCDKSPQPPVVTPPPAAETVNGTERIGWDQPAADAVELAGIGYVVYLDGARTDLASVTCGSAAASAGFPCTAKLPSMSPGAHTLELASFVNDGGLHESGRSAALKVTLVAQSTSSAEPRAAKIRAGLALHASNVAGGLDSPADIAFAPDGRIFVAERAGRIRIVSASTPLGAGPSTLLGAGGLVNEPALDLTGTLGARGQLLALALDPEFARTRSAFAIYTAPSRSGGTMFTLARFRAVSDTLGDRAVLLDGVPAASASAAAALRFGPDGKLYVAFDDGGDARRRGDAASLNGKVLRLNTDGTTPADAPGGNPVFAGGYGSPIALDWDPATATLWVADRAAGAAAFAFARGTLFPAWTGRMLSAATLFAPDRVPDIGVIAVGPDGAIYYGTAGGLGRLVPDRGP